MAAETNSSIPARNPGRTVLRFVLGIGSTVAVFWAFFAAAGGWDWWLGWVYVALLTVGQTVSAIIVKRRDPELLSRRGEYGEGTKGWDKAVLPVFALTYLAVMVVAALDADRGWSPLPLALWPLGAAMYVGGTAFVTWAMTVNTHFEKTVRIQADRGHVVCDRGPYRWIRHPGYVGASVGFPLATPLLLGSAWAFVPAVLSVASLVLRTALEDRMLRAELDGYEAFTNKTRYRLLPGVW